jgi:hypothetical protein
MMDWFTVLGTSRRARSVSAMARARLRPAPRRVALGLGASAAILVAAAPPASTVRADGMGTRGAGVTVADGAAGPIAPRLLAATRLRPRGRPSAVTGPERS